MTPLLRVDGLTHAYRLPHGELRLFQELDLSIAQGELVAIVGASGSGKSTLLHLLATLDAPSGGTVYFKEQPLNALDHRQAAGFRNRELGFVWQFHHLLPEFTAQENVAMPLLARGDDHKTAMSKAAEWLGKVGLADRKQHRSGELSGGEQQRCALARALVTNPSLLLADEPTGDLDNRTAEDVFTLIQDLHRRHGLTTLLVTHNEDFARRCDRMLRLEACRLTPETVTVN